MRTAGFGCRNYKPFAEGVELELRPLTLLFGRNGSGKSSLARLPHLLLAACGPAGAPVDLASWLERALSAGEGTLLAARLRSPGLSKKERLRLLDQAYRLLPAELRSSFFALAWGSEQGQGALPLTVGELSFGRSFRDLVHERLPQGWVELRLALEDGEGRLDLRARVQALQLDLLEESSYVARLEIRGGRGPGAPPPFVRELDRPPRDPHPAPGLLPPPEPDEPPLLSRFRRAALQAEERGVLHLGPLRHPLPAAVLESESVPPLGLDGRGAAAWLLADPALREDVSSWLAGAFEGWELELEGGAGDSRGLFFRRGELRVPAPEMAQGFHQLLPVAVLGRALARKRLPGQVELPALVVVEQPELHLHAAAQLPLGDLFVEAAIRRSAPLLVETHSEHLLLRVRRRVAEGRIDPDDVALYFLDELEGAPPRLRRIGLDARGNLEGWPEGVFSEDYEEVRALHRARRRLRGD